MLTDHGPNRSPALNSDVGPRNPNDPPSPTRTPDDCTEAVNVTETLRRHPDPGESLERYSQPAVLSESPMQSFPRPCTGIATQRHPRTGRARSDLALRQHHSSRADVGVQLPAILVKEQRGPAHWWSG